MSQRTNTQVDGKSPKTHPRVLDGLSGEASLNRKASYRTFKDIGEIAGNTSTNEIKEFIEYLGTHHSYGGEGTQDPLMMRTFFSTEWNNPDMTQTLPLEVGPILYSVKWPLFLASITWRRSTDVATKCTSKFSKQSNPNSAIKGSNKTSIIDFRSS